MPDRNIYRDIAIRTGGDLYIGVVGPVRTGKSTFVKRFMELMVLPAMAEGPEKTRAIDELPLSASGTMVTTSEPKFIPKEAAQIDVDGIQAKFRLVDCVGFMTSGADAASEQHTERMVKTPWLDYEIPFSKAAEIGTFKVIHDHSQIGIVVTTDGTFTDILRENYVEPEERTVAELKKISKPFVILLNSAKPYAKETTALAAELEEKYQVTVLPVNCLQMKKEDAARILESILYEFPLMKTEFYLPSWIDMLDAEHPIRQSLTAFALDFIREVDSVRDFKRRGLTHEMPFVRDISVQNIDLSDGSAKIRVTFDDSCYYKALSELAGTPIEDEYDLIDLIRDFSVRKNEYAKVTEAINEVRTHGYGVVTPEREEITLDTPALIRHGSKYGVKIHASSPSIHMIRADIETEIAPIVGSEAQANDLIAYIRQSAENGTIWETNIFGKTIEQLVDDGMENKVSMLNEESRLKLQDTMKKIVNDSNGGMVCIII